MTSLTDSRKARPAPEKENARCFNCHGVGHFSSECPKPQMILCYNCRGLGHKTFECTQHFSCRNCGGAGHKERHCPNASGGSPSSDWQPESTYTPTPAEGWSDRGDGLLRLPPAVSEPRRRQPRASRGSPRRPSEATPRPPATWRSLEESPPPAQQTETDLQDVLKSYLDTILGETSTVATLTIPQQNQQRPQSEIGRRQPDDLSPPPLLHSRSLQLEEQRSDCGEHHTRANSSYNDRPTGGGRKQQLILEFDRSRASSSHTRMLESSASWLEDEGEWDAATMSYDPRTRQASFSLDLLMGSNQRQQNTSTLMKPPRVLGTEEMVVAIGASSTQIAFSMPTSRLSLPNELAIKYSPSVSVVGRPLWFLNPAVLFAGGPVIPADWTRSESTEVQATTLAGGAPPVVEVSAAPDAE